MAVFAENGRIIGNVIYGLTVTTYFGLIGIQSIRLRMLNPDDGPGAMSSVRIAITILVLSCMLISSYSVTLMFLLMPSGSYESLMEAWAVDPNGMPDQKKFLWFATLAGVLSGINYLCIFIMFYLNGHCLIHPIKTFRIRRLNVS